MKIVCISDTHQLHKDLIIPEGDVLIHAGDFTNMGYSKEIEKFNTWLGSLPHQHKIVIAGNHDIMFEKEPERARQMITNAVYLQDESYEIPYGDGVIKLYGSPWSTPFFPQHWVFNADRGERLRGIWQNIPEDTDILITHGPPFGFGDRVLRIRNENYGDTMQDMNQDFAFAHGGRVGDQDLIARVTKVQPRLHIFGHIHEDRGEWRFEWSSGKVTTFANLSIWDHNNGTVRDPVVYEWDIDV